MWEDGRWLVRAYWKRIAFFTLVGVALAAAYNRWSPPEYTSKATVRFIPPQVADAYVPTNLAMQVEQRIFAVSQIATSRMTATQMIDAYGLYPQRRRLYPVADLVGDFQKRLKFSTIVPQGLEKPIPSILISFSDADPNKAQAVVQRIVELVYEENRRYRTDEALGTTDFLDQEIKTVTEHIGQLEQQLARLPTPGGEDKEYRNIIKTENLYSLERRVTEIEHDADLQESERNLRKTAVADLEGQLARRVERGPTHNPTNTIQTERLRAALNTAQINYEDLHRRYKSTVPDVRTAQVLVANLQGQLNDQIKQDAQLEYEREVAAIREPLARAHTELTGFDETAQNERKEQARLGAEIVKIRQQFAVGPEVENARLQLMREYEAAKAQYAQLSRSQHESHMSSDMERRGHGETAELVEPPTLPLRPEMPTEVVILGIGTVFGMLMGYGLSFLSFLSAPKVRTRRHIDLLGDYPVLASLPGRTPLFPGAKRGVTSYAKLMMVIAAVAVLTTTACGLGGNRLQTELSAGNIALKARDFRVAEIRFRKAITIDARNADAYVGLSQAYLASGDSMRAYEQLIRAEELLPSRADIAEHVADLTYQIYFADPGRPVTRLRELEVRATKLMKTWPGRAPGYRLEGLVLVERHRNAEAIELMENALSRVEDCDLRTQLASVYYQSGDKAKAEEQLRRAMKFNSHYVPAFDLLYLQLMDRGAVAAAREVLDSKLQHNHNIDTALQLAAHDDAVGSRPMAEELIEKSGRDFAADREAFAKIGDFWLHRAEYDRARRWYRDGMTRYKDSRGLYAGRMAEVLLAEKNPEAAQSLVDEELAAHPKDLFLRAYQAALKLDTPSEVERHKMQAELESVMAKMPDSPFVRLHLGRAYLLNGDALRAGELFRSAVTLDPNYAPGWLALADVQLRSGNTAQAEEGLKLLLRRAPNYAPARLLEAQASLAQNKPAEADEALTALLAADPDNAEVAMALARAKIALGQMEAAVQLLNRSASLRPSDPRPVMLVARLDVDFGQPKAALSSMEAAQSRFGDVPEFASMLGSVALVANQPEAALAQFGKLLKRDETNLQYRLGYASSLAMSGRAAQAQEQFQYVQKKSGKDPQPWLLYGAMMSSAGNAPAASAAYQEVLKRDSKNAYALNNLAFLLARRGQDLDRALTMAEEARHELPQSPEIGDTLAYIYVCKGMKRNAAATLEQLAANMPASRQKRTRGMIAQIERGDLRSVRAAMERDNASN